MSDRKELELFVDQEGYLVVKDPKGQEENLDEIAIRDDGDHIHFDDGTVVSVRRNKDQVYQFKVVKAGTNHLNFDHQHPEELSHTETLTLRFIRGWKWLEVFADAEVDPDELIQTIQDMVESCTNITLLWLIFTAMKEGGA